MTSMDVSLGQLVGLQYELQSESFGVDPLRLTDEERIEFIRWNVLALTDELHELLQEVGWKPWATSRHVNEPEATGELVDALHFFMNLLLAVAPRGSTPEDVAAETARRYLAKRKVNAARQRDGYDGVTGKCVDCKRDLGEVKRSTFDPTRCPICADRRTSS